MSFKDNHFVDSRGNTIERSENEPVTWRIGGYVIIRDHQDRFLMVQSGSGLWQFPGGGIEQDESVAPGTAREVLEETGYAASINDSYPYFMREQNFHHTRENAFYHSIMLYFHAVLIEEKPNNEAISLRDRERKRAWVDLATLSREELYPTLHELVEKMERVKT